ncbi:hypothetical protein ACQ4PT_037453 [Festuca glaucescens]
MRRSADAGGSQARLVQALEVGEEAETPFSRGLRRERAIRDGPAGLSVVERGESSYARVLRQEQELREAALAAVVGGRPAVDVAADIGAARPARKRCIIYRTREVDEAERALKWGLVAFVSGTRRAVSCSAASAAVLERFPALDGHFSVHRFWPADLLFVFDSRATRNTLLAADPFDGRDFSLRFSVWNRQLQATRRTMRYRVHLEVVGVPTVAWNLATARMILGSSAWVERLGTETASREDMGSFRITAWTDDPASIPKTKEVWVAEPLLFGDEDDDLLLPVEALIPEEVALLGHEATAADVGPRWPKGSPVLWAIDDEPQSPRGPLSPSGPLSPATSVSSRGSGGFGSPLSYFTVELSQAAAAGVAHEELEEGEIVQTAPRAAAAVPVVSMDGSPDAAAATSQAVAATLVAGGPVPSSSTSTGLDLRLASFRDRCRQRRAALLPKPAPKRPRKKRAPPSVVRRSRRVAGRFAAGTPIKQQQKALMLQLGITREGEVIGDEALDAYLSYFDKTMSEEDLTACLALFGWLPSALPLADVEEDVVV